MINPNTLLSEEEIAILRDSKDWRNYLAIFSIWAQIALGFFMLFSDCFRRGLALAAGQLLTVFSR